MFSKTKIVKNSINLVQKRKKQLLQKSVWLKIKTVPCRSFKIYKLKSNYYLNQDISVKLTY